MIYRRPRTLTSFNRFYSDIPKFNTSFIDPPRKNESQIKPTATNISQDELFHFQQLAPTWWDTQGSQRILHKMNLARLDFIQSTLKQLVTIKNNDIYVPGFNYRDHLPTLISDAIEKDIGNEVHHLLHAKKLNVLDVGCGGGILSESLARLPFIQTVTAIDLTPECIEVAKSHAEKDPLVAGKVFYKHMPLGKVHGQFDIITMFEMLEHVDQPSEILQESWDRLKPNGILFLSTINRDPISWFTTIFMGERVLKIVPEGTHHVEKYINSSEIEEWFKENAPSKYKVLGTKGTMYLPLKGWIEHDCTSIGNYFMAVKKLA